jgi:hypothetical protein
VVNGSEGCDRGIGDRARGYQAWVERLEAFDRWRSVRLDLRSVSATHSCAVQVGDSGGECCDHPLLLVSPDPRWVDEEGLLSQRGRCPCGLLSGTRSVLLLPCDAAGGTNDAPASSPCESEQPTLGHQLGGRLRVRASTICRSGAIAQLGERVAGSDEVAGSIPAGSIRCPPFEARIVARRTPPAGPALSSPCDQAGRCGTAATTSSSRSSRAPAPSLSSRCSSAFSPLGAHVSLGSLYVFAVLPVAPQPARPLSQAAAALRAQRDALERALPTRLAVSPSL